MADYGTRNSTKKACRMVFCTLPGKDSGVKWRHNALRHSFISYRVAKIKNVNEVAMEAGNSPDMIFKHDRKLATETEADAWFGVTPGSRGCAQEEAGG